MPSTIKTGSGPMRMSAFVLLTLFVVGCNNGGSLVQEASPERVANSAPQSEAPANANPSSPVETVPSPDANAATDPPTPATPDTAGSSPANPHDKGEVEVIGFDDLVLGMSEDVRFRPVMLQYNDGRAKDLLGKVVNIGGYMNPPDALRGLTEFILLKNTNCKFGPGGQADHLARVYLKEGATIDYTDKVIYVEGRIKLNPFPIDSPVTWSIYDIEATNVSSRPPSRQR